MILTFMQENPDSLAPEICVLVVAAGAGSRFGGEVPKQYHLVAGRMLLRHTIDHLLAHPKIADVRVVYNPNHDELYQQAVEGLHLPPPVPGGATRQDSVRLGLEALRLEALGASPPPLVLIHDAARPFTSLAVIDRVISALEKAPGAVAGLPVVDTLRREDGGEAPSRDGLWRAQTPQGFRFEDILAAHQTAQGRDFTDDASIAEAAGLEVQMVLGDEVLFKVTTAQDLAWAARHLAVEMETRTGGGFDVHRFSPGDHVMLCGVAIPHDHGLEGHSDADVAMHALTDAILGAISAGDIGTHFPPSDARWRGAASDIFLRRAGELVALRGGRIVNLDVTIICQAPRIGPHRAAMVARIAEILDLSPGRVSIKATTTEKLGFTGRSEGIAAQATANVKVPLDDD